MVNEEKDIPLLDSFLLEELPNNEREVVEERLLSDPDFKQLHDQLKSAISGIQYAGKERIMSKLAQIEEGYLRENVRAERLSYHWPIGIAASIIVCATLLWISFRAQTRTNPVFKEVFVPYTNVIFPTTRGASGSSTLSNAYYAYDRGDYQTAISSFESLPKQNADVLLYLANCYLAIGDSKKARERLEMLEKQFDTFHDQADWFLALTELSEDNYQDCVQRLNDIIRKKSTYSKQASELIMRIRETPSK